MPRVLVTRAEGDNAALSARLRAAGFEPVEVPLLSIVHFGPYVWDERSLPDLVVFASGHAVEATGAPPRADLPCVAVGPATARRARALGWGVKEVPEPYTAEALLVALANPRGLRVLVPRSAAADRGVVDALAARGALAHDWIAYANTCPAGAAAALRRVAPVQVVTLCSASAAQRLVESAFELGDAKVACIGPSTAAAAQTAGLPVHAVASPHTLDGLVEAVRDLMRR